MLRNIIPAKQNGFCTENDGFLTENDEFLTENDEFCTENDLLFTENGESFFVPGSRRGRIDHRTRSGAIASLPKPF